MKKLYTTCLIILSTLSVDAQIWYDETVGTPSAPTPVNTYTGWINQGLLNYSGTAMVDTANPSNNTYGSGGGNILFSNTVGTSLQVSGFPAIQDAVYLNINFSMQGHSVANPNAPTDLQLQVSVDSGSTWTNVQYGWAFTMFPNPPQPTAWDYFTAGFNLPYIFNPTPNPFDNDYTYADLTKVFVRFTQTGSTNSYRIDDVHIFPIVLLDIKLVSFNAIAQSGFTELSWTANTDNTKDIFYLEKSTDGKNFKTINEQSAKGKGQFSYSFKEAIEKSTVYYRLKMMEINGKLSYSNILQVSPNNNTGSDFNLYPNPVKDVLFVEVSSTSTRYFSVVITDLRGNVVKHFNLPPSQTGIFQVPVSKLSTGMYMLTIDDGVKKEVKKFVVE